MTCVIFVTCPTKRKARQISRTLIEKRLVACVTMIPGTESMYWWEDKVERASETLLMIKTRSELFDRVEREISQLHPYEVPEIIAVQIVQGAKKYLTWLKQVTKARG